VTVVFDGAPLPSKRETEISRHKAREESLIRARELEASGDTTQANAFYAKSVDVSPEMAFKVAKAIKPMGVEVLVAPYEADAQLAYLSRNNLVDFIISEDSDLLVYQCSRVLYKFDYKTEKGREIVHSNIFQNHPEFSRMSPLSFLITCVLSGCDYLSSLNQIGIRKASLIGTRLESFLSPSVPLDSIVNRVITLLKLSNFNPDDIEDFPTQLCRAILTFQHQTVFCPTRKQLVHLSPITDPINDYSEFFGEFYDMKIAQQVANCDIHPETKQPFCLDTATTESVDRSARGSVKKRPIKSNHGLQKRNGDESKILTLMACWNSENKDRQETVAPPDCVCRPDETVVISQSPVSPICISSDSPSPQIRPFKITRLVHPQSEDCRLDLDQFSIDVYVSK